MALASKKYHIFLRFTHWFMALCIFGLIAVGFYMTELDKADPLRPQLYMLHKSFGILMLLAVVFRFSIRNFTNVPPLPGSIPFHERALAKLVQFALYVLMVAVPFSGLYMSIAGGFPVHFFGVPVVQLFEKNKEYAMLAYEAHGIIPYVLLGLVALHAAGAFKHRFFDKNKKNDVFERML
jgi:cytochrome b561